MAQRLFLSVLFGMALVCGGCAGSHVPFTRMHFERFEAELDQVQFYISQQVEMSRASAEESHQVSDRGHRLAVAREKRVEKILIDACTAGVLQRIEGDTLYIQFEPPRGDARRALPFRATPLYPNETAPETVVYLLDSPQLSYDGQIYEVGYIEENAPVTHRDGAVYADKEGREDSVQYIQHRRFPILLINSVQETRRFREQKRKLPGLSIQAP